MSNNIININYREILNKVGNYGEYLESLNRIKYSWIVEIIEEAEKYQIDEDILPRDINKIRNLKKLDLSKYDIENLRHALYNLSYLNELVEVSLYSSTMDDYPLFLCNHKSIKKVSLNLPSITELTFYDFSPLKNLEELEIFGKNILLPQDSIHGLKNIKKLKLQGNIKELPESIKFCTSLERLDLSYNALEELPNEICLLRKLEYLGILHN